MVAVIPELIAAALVTAVAAGVRGTWSPCGLSMLSSITPFGERARGHRYSLTCGWFVVGSAVGGAVLGAVSALGALALSPVADGSAGWLMAVAVIAALLCMASDAAVGPIGLPTLPRQVDEAWLDVYRRWIYAAGFGAQIGAGFTTYVMTAATYLMVFLAVLSGSPAWAMATGLTFGVVRGLMVTVGSRASTPAQLRDLHRALERWAAPSLRLMVALQGAVAVSLAAALAGPVAAAGVFAACALIAARAFVRRRPQTSDPGGQLVGARSGP